MLTGVPGDVMNSRVLRCWQEPVLDVQYARFRRAISFENGLSWKSGRPKLGFRHTWLRGQDRHEGTRDTKEHEEVKVGIGLSQDSLSAAWCLRALVAMLEGYNSCGRVLSQPLLVALFLNSEGVILTCFLNTALKADFELKPTSSAIARTV